MKFKKIHGMESTRVGWLFKILRAAILGLLLVVLLLKLPLPFKFSHKKVTPPEPDRKLVEEVPRKTVAKQLGVPVETPEGEKIVEVLPAEIERDFGHDPDEGLPEVRQDVVDEDEPIDDPNDDTVNIKLDAGEKEPEKATNIDSEPSLENKEVAETEENPIGDENIVDDVENAPDVEEEEENEDAKDDTENTEADDTVDTPLTGQEGEISLAGDTADAAMDTAAADATADTVDTDITGQEQVIKLDPMMKGGKQGVKCSTAERLRLIHDTCEDLQINYNGSIFMDARNFARFFVQKNEKVIYCGLQSNGVKSWRTVLSEALGQPYEPQSMVQNRKLREQGIGFLSEFTLKDIKEMLVDESYKKVLVVKHPLTRFKSAYKMRVLDGPTWKKKKIKALLQKKLKVRTEGYNISLAHFAQYVVNEEVSESDRYWQTYQNLCYPCLVHFDDVIKSETNFTVDIEERDVTLTEAREVYRTTRLLPMFQTMDSDLVARLLYHYAIDMRMFGYGWQAMRSAATCSQPSVNSKDGKCC